MSEANRSWTSSPITSVTRRSQRRRPGWGVSLGFGLAIGIGVGGVADTLAAEWAAVNPALEIAREARPAPPLPKEWRWSPPRVDFGHMFHEPR
jgi:hypothetical protein